MNIPDNYYYDPTWRNEEHYLDCPMHEDKAELQHKYDRCACVEIYEERKAEAAERRAEWKADR